MGEGNRILLGLLLFSFAFSSFQLLSASNDDAIFYESFDEDFEGRWIVSDKGDYQGIFRNQELQHRFWSFLKIKDMVFRCLSTKSFFIVCPIDNCEKGFGEQAMEDLVFDFQELGSGAAIPSAWKHAKSEGHDDYGLLVSEQARKYAIVKELDAPVSLKDGTVVLQFETRLQKGLECGGAYLKYLRTQEAGWKPKEFDNEAPYSIMFGPDKCGATNKVHFILKHKNPKSGEYVEHHLKDTPSVPLDKLSHVYTAILKPDNELQILIDGEEKKKANFLSSEDFEPPLIPSKTIPDPDDTKPEDWDERAKIPDPDAVKPEDWDEDAPFEIEDEEAEKPEGWLDDEPEEIDDPDATKPEDWDDEEDGEWEAPKIDNPKCEAAPGCGEWKRPTKKNPAYKGKWSAPYIDNPAYKGIWKPQEIPNPNYFELEKPDFEPIAAIGIEIWTMQDGILFDNILIATDDKIAASYRETTWKPKFTIEKEKQKAEELAATSSDGLAGFQKKIFDLLYKIADIPFLSDHKLKIIDIIEKGEKQPNITIGILVSVVVVFLTIFFRLVFGGKKPARVVEKTNTGRTETSTNQAGEENEENKEKEETSAAPRRRTRREN